MANYKDIKYQFPTSAVTSGTFADARISQSSVTQHAATVDLQPIKSDITALALREATNEASAAFNLPNQFIDTFTDDTNLGTQTNGDRLSGFWATAYSLSYRYWEVYKTSSAAPGGYHRELEVYLDDVQQMTIINNARKTSINNHLLHYQIEQFKLLYKESYDNYCINE